MAVPTQSSQFYRCTLDRDQKHLTNLTSQRRNAHATGYFREAAEVGGQGLFHGTHPSNVVSIMRTGLDATAGSSRVKFLQWAWEKIGRVEGRHPLDLLDMNFSSELEAPDEGERPGSRFCMRHFGAPCIGSMVPLRLQSTFFTPINMQGATASRLPQRRRWATPLSSATPKSTTRCRRSSLHMLHRCNLRRTPWCRQRRGQCPVGQRSFAVRWILSFD